VTLWSFGCQVKLAGSRDARRYVLSLSAGHVPCRHIAINEFAAHPNSWVRINRQIGVSP
jgi:hypothetical protein